MEEGDDYSETQRYSNTMMNISLLKGVRKEVFLTEMSDNVTNFIDILNKESDTSMEESDLEESYYQSTRTLSVN